MFFVPRPQHTHQPMFATADTFHPRHPRYELGYPTLYDDDQAHLEAQHTARLRAWQQAEALRQRARVAARQRWEYEQQLVIQAAEEQAYRQLVARVRAQQALCQQAEARRQAQQEEQRRLAAAHRDRALKTALQRLVCDVLSGRLAEKAEQDTKQQSIQAPAHLPEKTPSQVSVEELLRQRASAESDPEVLVALNGLLLSLSSSPAVAPSSPDAPRPEPATAAPSVTPAPAPPSQVIRKPSLEALDRLSSTFAHLTSTFTLPQPDFSRPSSPGRPGSPTTRLPYTPANRSIHEYEAALGALLSQLDAVDAEGDDAVRLRRRELVKSVEAALAALDAAIEAQRREQGQPAEVPSAEEVTAEVDISVEDVQLHDIEVPVQAETPASSSPAAAAMEIAADVVSQSPPSPGTANSETPIADQITPASNAESDQDDFSLAADNAAAGLVDEHHLPDIQPSDTQEINSSPVDGTDAAISPSFDPLVDRPADISAPETTSAPSDATSPIVPPLSPVSTAVALETEGEPQLDTLLLPLRTPSPVLKPTVTEDSDEEAVLLDKIDSEEEWSETDA